MTQLHQSLILRTLQTPNHDQGPTAWRSYDIAEHFFMATPEAQDAPRPRIAKRFVPLIVAIPVLTAVCVLSVRLSRPLLRYRPVWTKAFIKEKVKNPETIPVDAKKLPRLTIALIALLVVGLALQVVTIFYPSRNISAVLPSTSWAVSLLLAVIDRPIKTPVGLLAILTSLLATQLSLLVSGQSWQVQNIPAYLEALLALGTFTIINCMPMRAPGLPSHQISPVSQVPTHELRSPEDKLTLWQFMTVSWMSPLIRLGSARQLNDEDVWGLGFEFQHRYLHDTFRELRGPVIRRLLTANGIDLVITSFLAILESVATFATPFLLQQLLRSMENPDAPRANAITYAILSLVVRLVATQSSVFSLWFCRRCYERSRGEMITMLHEKLLGRKIVGASAHLDVAEPPETNGIPASTEITASKAGSESTGPGRRFYDAMHGWFRFLKKEKSSPARVKEPASMGKILNLMRNDVYEVAQRFWEFQNLITKPLGLILSVILMWKIIGWSSLIGVMAIVLAQGLNIFITRALLKWERKRRTATDHKLQKTSEFVGAIRHLRWYGWHQFWLDQIMQSRKHELYLRVVTSLWGMLISATNNLASGMFPVVAFYAYTELAGQPLRIDIAFPALQLFTMLESNLREIPNLITMLLNAKIAVDRIEAFMSEPNKDENNTLPNIKERELAVQNGSFAWPGLSQLVLCDINLSFPVGLTVVCGKVAAGKTALLQALLGELDARGGRVTRSNETIGYCAQTPWLQSMSIRENILFSSPYDDTRYKRVLDACALTPDLASFKHGDLSNIGENGIGLSGGQKARVALARAVYSQANILLLDDPLSALDHQTAEIIVRKCFKGPLLEGRIAVLVTHRIGLCHDIAEQIIEIADGRAHIDRETIFSTHLDKVQSSDSANSSGMKRDEEQNLAAVPDKFIEDEHRAHGGVKAKVYWEYIKAGKLRWWLVLIFLMALRRLVAVGRTWFLKSWGEAYDRPSERIASGLFDSLPSPEVNVRPWLLCFLIFALAQSTIFIIVQATMVVIIYTAGRRMFEDVMNRVTNATFRFYDVTPIGRLMNRLTSDIGTVDGNISQQFQVAAFLFINWASSVVVIASVTPIFLIFSLALTATFVLIFIRFLPTSQSLRRLEMVSLSPLMSNFGALLEGLTTVRAFGAQSRFQDRVIAVTDTFQKMDHFYWSLQAWLMYRFDALSACSTFVLTMLALYTGVSPGLTAFVLLAAAQFVDATHGLCKQYGRLQMDFVSVERVVELLHLEQEPHGSIDPPAAWPSYTGEIIFEDVTIRYAPHLDPSLSNISFRIPGGSTTALLGRTGSGKSTLALSLLATILPEAGRILIDGIDISTVNIQNLRNRVTFLAQDPVLFPGTMRQNLDPLDEHSDEACQAVLQRIAATHQWTIKTLVEPGGKNLSQGQRQLVGLARAILRRSPVVILDEATASIDTETAMQIQQVLRDEMKESTVITIAHRLEAVRGVDYYIRLDKGRMIAQGYPTGDPVSG